MSKILFVRYVAVCIIVSTMVQCCEAAVPQNHLLLSNDELGANALQYSKDTPWYNLSFPASVSSVPPHTCTVWPAADDHLTVIARLQGQASSTDAL
jgi:hypothetical protein